MALLAIRAGRAAEAKEGVDVSPIIVQPKGKRGRWQEVGLSVARQLAAESEDGRVSVDDWRTECIKAGMVIRSTCLRVLPALSERGEVVVNADGLTFEVP